MQNEHHSAGRAIQQQREGERFAIVTASLKRGGGGNKHSYRVRGKTPLVERRGH